MFTSIGKFFSKLVDSVLPLRNNFAVVQKLDEEKINSLPRAVPVEDLDWIHPLLHYKDNRVRAIIWELKYRENTLPLDQIGRMLFEEILALTSDILLFDSDAEFLLIPIPITNERRSVRGYNQSELICRAIIENDVTRTLLYAPQWLSKTRETARQSHSVSRALRTKNLAGSFSADHRVENKYVILIDDVATTGSTLTEARSTLLSALAKDVFAFTIAH